MDEKVVKDLNEVRRKLQDAPMLSPHPRTSATSIDSGINSSIPSRNLSSSSLGHPDVPPEIYAPMEAIDENEGQTSSSPIITIEEPTTDEVESARKPSFSETIASHHLNIEAFQVSRKGSTDSVSSEEYKTPPTSLSRSMSVESSASSSSTPQEVRIKVQINFPASKETTTVITSAMVHKKLRHLQLNVSITPTPSRHSPIERCSYSPNINKKKLKVSSKSFDKESPKNLRNKKMLSSKSFDSYSPCMVLKNDRSRRRFRNNLIASIVRRYMVEFVDSTDIDTLSPHLYAKQLLSHNDMVELRSIPSDRGKKNFLYMLLLHSKGVDAYQKLYDSLKEAMQHSGHIDLVKIIDTELKQEMAQENM